MILPSRFDQFRSLVNAAFQALGMLKFLESVQSPDAYKEILGFDKKPVHGVPVLLRIAQIEVESTDKIRNKFGNLHEGDVSTETCARAQTVLLGWSADSF